MLITLPMSRASDVPGDVWVDSMAERLGLL
jgi:hypothetical protein